MNKRGHIFILATTILLIVVAVARYPWPEPKPEVATVTPTPTPYTFLNESSKPGHFTNSKEGIDFMYPKSWGTLTVERRYDPIVRFIASNKHIAQVALYIPTKTIVFIERDDITDIPDYAIERGNKLSQLFENGTTKRLYTMPPSYVAFGGEGVFSYVSFSPTGRYLSIPVFTSIETGVEKVFDLKTGKDVFGSSCVDTKMAKLISCPRSHSPHGSLDKGYFTIEELLSGITWFDNDRIAAITSFSDGAGFRVGIDGMFISDYGHPETLHIAFTLKKLSPPVPAEYYLDIKNISNTAEAVVAFDTVVSKDGTEETAVETRKFEYDTRTGVLNQLEYRPR